VQKLLPLKQKIQDAIKAEQNQINDIKARVEKEFDMDVDTKESFIKKLMSLKKKSLKKLKRF
jgi:hypothetical protein